ncbi:hypothetical protein [Dactylosporangium matsuzakiense]|uniref:DUF3558 domain-containing protein n=1 Tax=Dactylosporangium matsuzakiense TaxID=53360 RepID=A0A9W6NRH3_9ACTN|nr:hypothetical protein [Dactylosporangium matsuzakiense]UWZ46457.1 hypothetical protein Dmats_08545 [Dactylosporangium matsuzakiense]GLL06584.1 hypothetical protein GCM10017581_083340 [Dactylosporangium matsuzakiense]
MRRVLLAVVALSAMLVAACDDAGASPSTPPSTAPAAAAGGACQLLDFATVNAKLGLQLAVAAGASMDNSFTCVLEPPSGGYPDLVLAITTTTIAADVFTTTIQPSGAQAVPGLGAVAYQLQTPPADKSGPGVQIGWLAGNKRIITLSLHLPAGTADDKAAASGPKMVELAKLIDLSSL